jgi:hypothetical protein
VRLREHFSQAEIVELIFIIGYQTFASEFAKAFSCPARLFVLIADPRRGWRQDRSGVCADRQPARSGRVLPSSVPDDVVRFSRRSVPILDLDVRGGSSPSGTVASLCNLASSTSELRVP